jgi:hypothetical protein
MSSFSPAQDSFSSANRPCLDALGELDLLLGVEQGDLADLLEVVLDRVGGGAGGDDLLRRAASSSSSSRRTKPRRCGLGP